MAKWRGKRNGGPGVYALLDPEFDEWCCPELATTTSCDLADAYRHATGQYQPSAAGVVLTGLGYANWPDRRFVHRKPAPKPRPVTDQELKAAMRPRRRRRAVPYYAGPVDMNLANTIAVVTAAMAAIGVIATIVSRDWTPPAREPS